MLKKISLAGLSKLLFSLGLIGLVFNAILILLDHLGVASMVTELSFMLFLVGSLFYLIDLFKNKNNEVN